MKTQPQPLSRVQLAWLWLAGTLFSAVGIWLLVSICTDVLYASWRTRGGVTAQARLRSVESHTSGGGRGGTATSVSVRYDYQFGGRMFTGKRVAILKQDNDLYEALLSAYRSGTPIQVFVDPKHPDFSVIDREFPWWPVTVMVPFSLAFAGTGLFILRHLLRVGLAR